MFIFLVIVAALSLASLIVAAVAAKRPDDQKQEGVMQGPRSNYGDPIPIIFGTIQVDSPICICARDFFAEVPFAQGHTPIGIPTYSDADITTNQFRGSLDMLLSRRLTNAAGSPLSTIRLRKIWYGDNLLWNGENFGVPVTNSGSLLSWDPNVNNGAAKPGGVVSEYEVGSGWWYGGINPKSSAGNGGPVLGGFLNTWNGSTWTEGCGLERVRFYAGNGAETIDPTMSTNQFYPAYSNLVRLVFANFWFGPQQSILEVTAEITQSCPAPELGDSFGLMSLDVNPINVIFQLLTNPMFAGSTKMPQIDLPSFIAARTTVGNEGLGVSYRAVSPIKIRNMVEALLVVVDGVLYQEPTTGKIAIVLNRLVQSVVPSFTANDLLAKPSFNKTTWEATFSQSRITFTQRRLAANGMYATSVAVAKDPGLAAANGTFETLEETSDFAFDPNVANIMAANKLAIANSPLVKTELTFKRTANAMALRPGACFDFTYDPLGIGKTRMRVTSVDQGTLEDNSVKVAAIQDRYVPPPIVSAPKPPNQTVIVPPTPKFFTASVYTQQITAPYPIARMGLGGDPRKLLTSGQFSDIYAQPSGYNYDRFLFLAKRPYPKATRLDVQFADTRDGSVFNMQVPYTPSGTTLDAIPAFQLTNSLTVTTSDFRISGIEADTMATLSASGLKRNGQNIVLIDQEFILLETFTVLSASSINVTKYHRMIWDSPIDQVTSGAWAPAHSTNATVWFLDCRDQSTMRKKLTPLFDSNAFTPIEPMVGSGNIAFTPATPWDRKYASGYNTGRFEYVSNNVDPAFRNIPTSSSGLTIAERAALMMPPRQQWLSHSSATGFVSVLTVPGASATYDIQWGELIDGTRRSRSGQPREADFLVTPFDASTFPNFVAEENDPLVDGWSNMTSPRRDADSYEVWYNCLEVPAFATLRRATYMGTAGVLRFAIPVEATTRTWRLYVRRAYKAYSDRAVSMYSAPRGVLLTITRS